MLSERNISLRAQDMCFTFSLRYMFMYDVHVHVMDNYAYNYSSTCTVYDTFIGIPLLQ